MQQPNPFIKSYIKLVPNRFEAGTKMETWALSDGTSLELKTIKYGHTRRIATLILQGGERRSISVASLRVMVKAAKDAGVARH